MHSNYVPGPNAHIYTSEFEARLEELSEGASGSELEEMEFEEYAYREIDSRVNDAPREVSSEIVICRYLSTEKFLWFANTRKIFLGLVNAFDDMHDCAIPEDYWTATSRFYARKRGDFEAFESYVDHMRHRWFISCWTEISSSVDDYLLWHRYAGGPLGVGITVPYGKLHEALATGILATPDGSFIGDMVAGYVEYGSPLRVLPFNKRRMFRNEREIRFAVEAEWPPFLFVPVEDIFPAFGLRFSPDVPTQHRESIERVWLEFGGTDDFVVAGS